MSKFPIVQSENHDFLHASPQRLKMLNSYVDCIYRDWLYNYFEWCSNQIICYRKDNCHSKSRLLPLSRLMSDWWRTLTSLLCHYNAIWPVRWSSIDISVQIVNNNKIHWKIINPLQALPAIQVATTALMAFCRHIRLSEIDRIIKQQTCVCSALIANCEQLQQSCGEVSQCLWFVWS